jgi:hypothetical protein
LSKHEEKLDETRESLQVETQDNFNEPGQEQDEVEFRLFAPTSTHPDGVVSRIRVKSPEPSNDPVVIPRPDSYYFASEPTAAQKARFSYSAVSGADVLSRSRAPWPGCYLPWRVITISSSGKVLRQLKKHASASLEDDDVMRKRKRKGKKARIAIRKKIAADKECAGREAMSKEEREIQEKIKRAKRNHEKKVKQRERNKRKKAEAAAAVGRPLDPNHPETQPEVNSEE